jgi:16S rRNA (guanine527-N7)-methyltransferase
MLSERAEHAGISIAPALRDRLLTYYDLLVHWNRTINLTALSDPNEAIDRLLLEPIAAATLLPSRCRLLDLGSGGGSPAIPLALALDATALVMVESKARKAAFLREAARAVGIAAVVEAQRFEALASSGNHLSGFDVVSLRAVRMDAATLTTATSFLSASGLLALFISAGQSVNLPASLQLHRRSMLVGSSELLEVVHVPRETEH